MTSNQESRRGFLGYLAASPLPGGAPRALGQFDFTLTGTLISSPDEAVNVFDFELVDRNNLTLGHYVYMMPGADAVCIGRPCLWGLSAFGQEGVETVLDLLRREPVVMMQQAGTTSLNAISRNHPVG